MISERSCGALVYTKIDNELKYLVIKQKYTNHYGFPKGHIEKGETKEQTAIREIYEETNIKVDLNNTIFKEVYYEPKPGIKKEVTFFLAKALNTNFKIQVEEVLEIHWLNEKEVLNMLTYENDKDVFKYLTEGIGLLL